ncbi:PqqD family peptide modification chaperone [Nocardia brevicatena]|uniref:PqqD family peptide modification chaperone n=1 Tax=Nocardia brevicatena TaxID=37327 RepID=UPI0002D427F7|nr:PqqD family peptide modification chaperone [Nocardia brevicatena]
MTTSTVDRPKAVAASAKQTGDVWVLVPAGDGEVAVVDELGYEVMQRCDGTRSCADIVRELTAHHGGRPVDGEAVSEFVTRMRAAVLLDAA